MQEALAIRWACEIGYSYLVGIQCTVVTDYKPLVPVFNNPRSKPPMRLEKWLLHAQQFDFKLICSPGKDNITDYLSRHSLPISIEEKQKSKNCDNIGHKLIPSPFSPVSSQEVQVATTNDPKMQQLIPLISEGNMEKTKPNLKMIDFRQIFHELCYVENVIMRGNQIVISEILQNRVLDICNEAHLGRVKSKQVLRSKVWFPDID